MSALITGVGGIFLRANDPEALYQWYEKHLGLARQHGCFIFPPNTQGADLALTFFKKSDTYFDPAQPAMLNALASAGATIDPKRDEYDFGRFAWCTDPEGNRVELWQPLP
jgi:predicted enzyme related to lactoylglutathione lyase